MYPSNSNIVLCTMYAFLFLKPYCHTVHLATPPQAGSQPTVPLPIQVLKPNELFYSKIMPLLKEKGLSEQTPRKEWPTQIQLRVLKELMNETPSDLLEK